MFEDPTFDLDDMVEIQEAWYTDFPETRPQPSLDESIPLPVERPLADDELAGHLSRNINACLRVMARNPYQMEAYNDALTSMALPSFLREFTEVSSLFNQCTTCLCPAAEQAIQSVPSRSRRGMWRLLDWLCFYSMYGPVPMRSSKLKTVIVDRKKILNDRTFTRYINKLCDLGILERQEHVRKYRRTKEGKFKKNVYYKINCNLIEAHVSPDQLIHQMPSILKILARFAFEKHLAMAHLQKNGLLQEFERENSERNPLIAS